MKSIITDTGPLLHLWEIDALHLLALAGVVHVPPAVESEMARLVSNWADQHPPWLKSHSLTETSFRTAQAWQKAGLLDPGEAEALALTRQLNADWFLTDETAARVWANELNIEVHGSLGIILWAAAQHHCSRTEAEDYLKRLSQSTLWVSARVLSQAQVALEALF